MATIKNRQPIMDLREALDSISQEIEKVNKGREKVQKKLDQMDEVVRELKKEEAVYKNALHLLEKRFGIDVIMKQRFGGMSRREACTVIMKENNGQANITELIPQLSAAGLLPINRRRAWDKVRNTLEQRRDVFEKIGPGRYALRKSPSKELLIEEPLPNKGRPPKPVRDEAFKILEIEGQPLHCVSLLEKLQERGIRVEGQNPRNNLLAHLNHDPRFKRVAPATWGLLKWDGDKPHQQLPTS